MTNEQIMARMKAKCKELDIDIDFDAGGACDMWTPKGKVFVASDCHTCCQGYGPMSGTFSEALRSLRRDLNMGIRDCDNPNYNHGGCNYCTGKED
jgi:hypothetical protein